MNVKQCILRLLDMDNYDRRGERLIKKSIALYHKGGKLDKLRAIRLSHRVHRDFACEIPPRVTIGRNLYIAHPHGIHIGKTARFGDDCRVYPGATVVSALKDDMALRDSGRPWHAQIGNGVVLGARCLIVGAVTIGDDVTIGAGATVTKDVPAHTVVKGVNQFRPKRPEEINDKFRNAR